MKFCLWCIQATVLLGQLRQKNIAVDSVLVILLKKFNTSRELVKAKFTLCYIRQKIIFDGQVQSKKNPKVGAKRGGVATYIQYTTSYYYTSLSAKKILKKRGMYSSTSRGSE
jgi:hypothetical protein